jgi:hypothetical protein
MANENKGLLLDGHVGKLQREYGVTLTENSAAGLEAALNKHSNAIFSIVNDEIRNIPATGNITMAEMEYAEDPKSTGTAMYKQEVAIALDRARRWIPIAEYLLTLNSEDTQGRKLLVEIVARYKDSLAGWQARLDKLK